MGSFGGSEKAKSLKGRRKKRSKRPKPTS